MDKQELAREIFVRMAQGTHPSREIPAAMLEKSARLALLAADVFIRVAGEGASAGVASVAVGGGRGK